MALSALALLDALREHLEATAAVTDLVAERIYHGRADLEALAPFALYRIPKLDHRDAQGFGPDAASGQTIDATLSLTAVDEASEPKGLVEIANALDDAIRAWAPAGWSVRELELLEERTDAFDSGGRTYQSAHAVYTLILERA